MPPMRPGEIVIGDDRRNGDGKIEIRAHRKWIPYPEEAAALIDLAIAHGWGTDDGLPTRHSQDGEISIRILLGREPGLNALTNRMSKGIQFHLTWWLHGDEWRKGEAYANLGTRAWSAWRRSSPELARQVIAGSPVVLPSIYADEKENAC